MKLRQVVRLQLQHRLRPLVHLLLPFLGPIRLLELVDENIDRVSVPIFDSGVELATIQWKVLQSSCVVQAGDGVSLIVAVAIFSLLRIHFY